MSLNWQEIDLVLSEINLENRFIQTIWQDSFKHLALGIYPPDYKDHQFSIFLDPKFIHLAWSKTRKPKGKKASRFIELLKSRILGGRITECYQYGAERIIIIHIHRAGEDYGLVLRLWDNRQNIFLCSQEGIIIDALYRRPKQGETSDHLLQLPGIPENAGNSFWELVAEKSKILKEEGDSDKFPIRSFQDEKIQSEDYKQQLQEYEKSFWSKVHLIYQEQMGQNRYELERKILTKIIEEQLNDFSIEKRNLEESLNQAMKYQELRHQADLLAANLHKINTGETEIELEDFETSKNHKITLDPKLTPSKNLEVLYQKAKKEERSISYRKENLKNIQIKLSFLEECKSNLEECRDFTQIKEIKEALGLDLEIQNKQTAKKQSNIPGLQFVSQGYPIYVGRTSKDNETLLRKHCRGNDLWLHTRDYPGAYVFIKSKKNKTVPLEVLLDAGNLAVLYSKARSNGVADLYYTQVKHLRKPKGAKAGLVLPTQEKNLHIRLDDQRLKRLQSSN